MLHLRPVSHVDVALRRQARVLGRYLLLEEPADSVVAAYVAGCAAVLGEVDDVLTDPVLDLAMTTPALLPLLDGAVAWRGADELLRRKLLLLLAVAEASPAHVDAFDGDPDPEALREVLLQLAVGGLKAGLGLGLLRVLGR